MTTDEWAMLRWNGGDSPRVTLGRLRDKFFAAQALRPVLVLGPQRSRKTTGIVIPTLLGWPGPAIVTSVRTDVIDATMRARSQHGSSWIFEPSGRYAKGHATTGWNPLTDCCVWDDSIRTARWLTEAGSVRGGVENGDFWAEKAAQLLAPILLAAGVNGYDMSDVMRWINTGEIDEVQDVLRAPGHEVALNAFKGVVELESRARDGVYTTLTQIMSVYEYSEVIRSTVQGSFKVADLFDGRPNTLYLCAPPDEQEELAPLFTSLVRRVLREAYQLEAQGITGPESASPLLVLLDEAGNIAPLQNLDTLATTAAGTGIQLVSVFHDLSQMTTIYGQAKARTIANNHSALLLLPGNRDPLTNELLQQLLGEEKAQGWRDPYTGTSVSPSGSSPFRRLQPGTALCIYEHLSPLVLTLRSFSHDSQYERIRELISSDATATAAVRFAGESGAVK